MQSVLQRFNAERPTRYGRMMFNRLDQYVGKSLMLYGEFSEGEVELFRALVQPGQRVLDIGANVGAHTVPFAHLVGPDGEVLAFEPQRQLYYCLCGNIALNALPNVWAYQVGVGSRDGETKMPRWSYQAPNNFGGMPLGEWPDGIPVRVVALDGMHLQDVDLLKVDVEGMEREVLEGAKELIGAHQPILYVENDRDEKAQALLEYIMGTLEYCPFWHTPPLYNPNNWDRNPTNVFHDTVSLNLLCFSELEIREGRGPEHFGLTVLDQPPADGNVSNLQLMPVRMPSRLTLQP